MEDTMKIMLGFNGESQDVPNRGPGLERLETGHQRMEKRFQAPEDLYRIVLDSVADGVHVVDRDLCVVLINARLASWLEELGLMKDIVGQPLREAFPFISDKVYDQYHYVLETGTTVITEEATTVGHREYFTETRKIPVIEEGRVNKVVTIIRDLTEIKQAQLAVMSEKNKLQSLIDALDCGLTLQDREYNIVFRNKFMREMFGANVGEKCYHAYEFHEHVCEGCPVELSFKDGMSHATERRVSMPSGRTIIFENTATPIRDANGNIAVCLEIVRDVTERKQAEEDLRESQERAEKLFRTSIIPQIVMDAETGEYIDCNEAAVQIYGYANREEVLGKTPADVSAPTQYDGSDSATEAMKRIQTCRDNSFHVFEWRHQRPDGQIWDADVHMMLFRHRGKPLMQFSLLDITERKKAVDALRRAEKKYRGIFENAVMGIFQTTPEGRYLSVNPAGARMYGYESPEDMIESIADMAHQVYVSPADRKRFKEIIETRGYVENFEAEHFRKDGSKIWSSMNARAIRDASEVTRCYETTAQDITERKHLESQLRQSQKMEAIGTLAGGIAHDFNNILTVLVGYGSLLKMQMEDDDRRKHYVNQMLTSSQKAANLTQSLLAFGRKQMMELKPCKVNTIIRGVEKLLKRLLTEDIEFTVMLAPRDVTIMADMTQIDQVLINLAANARDAMPGGGRLIITTNEFQLDNKFIQSHGFGEPGTYALISITDTGCGIDKNIKEKIFEPFFTTKEVGKGTGLGLSIVYGIIKQHEGYITVSSEPRKGTTFDIYIPITKTKTEETGKNTAEIEGGTELILVAEDNYELRRLIREVLTSRGYAVVDAIDGEDAVWKFMEHKDNIDLLLLDVVMPRMNGKEVYEAIRKVRTDVKVLFTSGYTGDVVFDKGINDGAFNFISKPVSPNELLLKVRTVLDN
ncbi:MAG: Blue-light-activated protein [Syntrophorhabdus sp. PtaU1.Bin002]|nr:MAG: Blue-light-activated protein [Syntrophorhabdus sp. PtaU1.Bin002]